MSNKYYCLTIPIFITFAGTIEITFLWVHRKGGSIISQKILCGMILRFVGIVYVNFCRHSTRYMLCYITNGLDRR